MSIEARGISKSHRGIVYLDNISFEIKENDFVTLLGPTGSGKTTLLRILCGVEKPDEGRVYVDGMDVTDLPVQKRDVAMVYQQFINYPSYTVYENIASPMRISKNKYSEAEIDVKVREYADLLGLTSVLSHLPEEVSGGQRQRTAIARALAKNVNFIILDEPLANLDYKLREELRGELKRIFRNKGGAVLYATPEPIDALAMSTHVGVMHQGRMLQFGPVGEVFRNPRSIEVGTYFSHPTMNVLDAELVRSGDSQYLQCSNELKIDVSDCSHLAAQKYKVGIHAHTISTEKEKKNMIPIKAEVQLSEVVGSDTELHIQHQDIPIVLLMQKMVTKKIGESITVYIDPDRIFIYDTETNHLVAKTGE